MVERKCGPGVSIVLHSTLTFINLFCQCFPVTKPAWYEALSFPHCYLLSSSIIRVFNVFRWNAELVLQGGDDGKLKTEVKNVKVDVGSQQGYFWVQENSKQQLQGILNDVQSHIEKKENEISDTMNHLKGEVEQLFGKSWKFVLRGDDDFLINKAAFNRRVS